MGPVSSKQFLYHLSKITFSCARKLHNFFCLERATIAYGLRTPTNSPVDCLSGKQVNEVNWPEGGASEDQKIVAELTQQN
jgi:hypothetical protein